jgi:hypothetical protein
MRLFAACDDSVGRAPWPAADPLVGLFGCAKSRTRGSGADKGVRPTFRLPLCSFVGQVANLRRVVNPPPDLCVCPPEEP